MAKSNINYCQRVVNMAKLVTNMRQSFAAYSFVQAYRKVMRLQEDTRLPFDSILITYVMRMASVPANMFPNIKSSEDLLIWAKKSRCIHLPTDPMYSPPDIGDIVLIASTKTMQLGIVIDELESKISVVTLVYDRSENEASSIPSATIRTINRSSGFIKWYVRPDYDTVVETLMYKSTRLSSLVKGTYISEFKTWLYQNIFCQHSISEKFSSPDSIDGKFKRDVIRAWGTILLSDKKCTVNLKTVPESLGDHWTDLFYELSGCKHIRARSHGQCVIFLQYLLYAHGYDPKSVNGKYDAYTKKAVVAFQEARHLPVSGEVDQQTWESLVTKW